MAKEGDTVDGERRALLRRISRRLGRTLDGKAVFPADGVKGITRRQFLTYAGIGAGAAVISATGVNEVARLGRTKKNTVTGYSSHAGSDVHTHDIPDQGPVTIHGIEFQNVVNAVDDLGMDPTGNTPNDAEFQNSIQDDTVIFFPPGEYLFTEWWNPVQAENFAIIGTGESHRDVQFKPPGPDSQYYVDQSNKWLRIMDGENVLLENLSFNALDNDVSDFMVDIRVQDNLQIRQVEWMGRIPKNDTGTQLFTEIKDETGTGYCEKIAFGTKYGAVIEEYPNTRAMTVGSNHRGVLRVNRGRWENLGGSAIRNTHASGRVILENSYFKNVFNAAIRINANPGDVARNCEIIVDDADQDKISADLIRTDSESGSCTDGGLVENCDMFVAEGVNMTGGIVNRGFSSVKDLTVRDCRIEYNTTDAAAIRVRNDGCGGEWTVEDMSVSGSGSVSPENEKDGVLRNCCFPERADLSDWSVENVTKGQCDRPMFSLMNHDGFWPRPGAEASSDYPSGSSDGGSSIGSGSSGSGGIPAACLKYFRSG